MEQKNNLNAKRHSLAHLLAAAVRELWPEAKNTIGPAIDNGFYYDFDFGETKISDADLPKIEEKMQKLLPTWNKFTHQEVSAEEAKKQFVGNEYKHELIDEIAGKGAPITLYTSGNFTDLCRGGHVENMDEVASDSFKLSRLAGAYWRGDEKNKMLTRIYGLAFETKAELEAYLKQQEEAAKRDHRKLGKELGLFTIIDEVGPGLPLFYPKGALLRSLVENFINDLQVKRGYLPIWIPHITRGELYKMSGHLDKYDAMYPPMKLKDEADYYLKPMNCPHFMMLYKSLPHSYRDLPIRYVCTTTNYRYEKSGELAGLTRVRALTQDDCHVFCTTEQIETEIALMLEMIKEVYAAFGLTDFYVRISLRDQKNKAAYLGGDVAWETAENALRAIVKKTGWQAVEAAGEAAFYGPKLDFMFKDAIGREWQLSTIQLDFNLPERFDLDYAASDGGKQRPVVIHRAILGSTERFLGIMIEHYAGAFPVWLAPVQVAILPISEAHHEYARQVFAELEKAGVRADLDLDNDSLGKKIRRHKLQKIPHLIVLGDAEVKNQKLTIESRDEGKMEGVGVDELVAKIKG